MGNATIRTFFALPVSINCQKEIDLITCEMKKDFPKSIRWTKNSQLHITIKFLGNFRPLDTAPMNLSLKMSLKPTKIFNLHFQNVGVFPTIKNPNVLWLGIKKSSQLKDLFDQIENASQNLGYPKDSRSFSPHLTIGRFNYINPQIQTKLANYINVQKNHKIFISEIDRVCFIESKLTPKGPHYSILFSIFFNSFQSVC